MDKEAITWLSDNRTEREAAVDALLTVDHLAQVQALGFRRSRGQIGKRVLRTYLVLPKTQPDLGFRVEATLFQNNLCRPKHSRVLG